MVQGISKRAAAGLIAVLLLLAVVVRGLFFLYPTLDADQAVVGLMGMDILEGHFPLMFWGQDYGGSLESIVAAGCFALFGVSRQSLYLSPTLMSFFYLWGVYLLGRALWGRRAGLCALLLASLGPFYLIWHSVLPRAIYIDTLALGVWLMWLTLKALRDGPRAPGYAWLCGAFGLLAGFALWCHMLAIYFILPCALLWWRRDPRLVIRPAFGLMMAAFFLGSMPLWLHNLLTNWSTYYFMLHPKPREPFGMSLAFIWQRSLPVILGAQHFAVKGAKGLVLPGLSQAVLVLVGLAGLGALLVWGGNLLKRLTRRDQGDGSELLLLVTASVVLVFAVMGLSSSGTHRYLVPLYAVYPLLLAWAYDRLLAWGRWGAVLGWSGLAAVALLLAVGVYQVSPLGDPSLKRRYGHEMAETRKLTGFLASHGVTHAYVPDYWMAPRLTFDSKMRVVYVVSRKDRNPAFERAILRARRFAVVLRGESQARRMAATLTSLGVQPQHAVLNGWNVFWDITPPPDAPRALAAQDWRLTASPAPNQAPGAADYNASMAWSTPGGQEPGQWLELDLGRVQEGVCSLLLFNGMAENAPHCLRLKGSPDGVSWEMLVQVEGLPVPFAWSADKLVALRWNNWQELRFAPRSLRYLRLEQIGQRPRWSWSVREMIVGKAGAARPSPARAASWLRARLGDETKVWCGPVLAAWLPRGMRPEPTRQAHPPWLPRSLRAHWLLPDSGPLHLAIEAGRAPYARAALQSAGWQVQSQEAHGYVLFTASPPTVGEPALAERWPPRLFWSGLLPMAARPTPVQGAGPQTPSQDK